MAIEFVIEAFAVVVIGGLGSMPGALVGALLVGLIRAGVAGHLSGVRDPRDLPDRHRRAAVQAVGPVRKAGDVMRGATLLAPRCRRRRARPGAGPGAAVLRQPAGAVLRLRHRAARLQSAVRLCRACCPSAMPCSSGSAPMALRSSPACSASGISRSCCSASALGALVVALPIGLLCVRYTGIFFGMLTLAFGMLRALVPVQVLPPDRRRQRHARAAHAHPGARVRRLQQDRAAGRALLLLLPGAAGARRPADVAHRALAVRAAPALAARQRAEGRVPGRARAPVPAGGVRDLGDLSARSAAPSWASASAWPIPSWCTGRTRAISCS